MSKAKSKSKLREVTAAITQSQFDGFVGLAAVSGYLIGLKRVVSLFKAAGEVGHGAVWDAKGIESSLNPYINAVVNSPVERAKVENVIREAIITAAETTCDQLTTDNEQAKQSGPVGGA